MKKTISLYSRKAGALVLTLTLGPASVGLTSTNIWTPKSPMPTARSSFTTSVVHGKIYAIGGFINANSGALSIVEEYDSKTDTWLAKANMSIARSGHGACVLDGQVYVMGGGQNVLGAGSSTVEQYDPETDTWARKANMPTARFVLSASVVNGKIYAIGGKPAYGVAPLTTVEEYDPATDTWISKTPMSTARFGLSTCVVDGKIYAIGGDPGSYIGLPTVEEYDPTTDTWTRKADMLTPRAYLSVSVLSGRIYAMGGESTLHGAGLSIVDEYDPTTDTWTRKSDMPTPRFLLSSSTIDDQIYIMGGAVESWPSWQGCSMLEVYDPGLSPDFNGDYQIDIEDLVLLIEYWGQDEPAFDIAPRPFGDGIIDVQDLEFLMSCWGQDIEDPTLIAHWKFDETEGDVAYDSTAVNHAAIIGDAIWRPNSGQLEGALQLGGIDNYVDTQFQLDPDAGPFSVFAWIRGGAAGQAIVSQLDGVNWLQVHDDGTLMTELTASRGRNKGPLYSDTVITDGNWHRIGFVWDGSNRILYLDDTVVAEDTQSNLKDSSDGLYIGVGSKLEYDTFWSGMLDDVRIYDRVVIP